MGLVHLGGETVNAAAPATVTPRATAPREGQTRRERRASVEAVAAPPEERALEEAADLAHHHA